MVPAGFYVIAKCKATKYKWKNDQGEVLDSDRSAMFTVDKLYPFYANNASFDILKCDYFDGVARSLPLDIFNQMFDIVNIA